MIEEIIQWKFKLIAGVLFAISHAQHDEKLTDNIESSREQILIEAGESQ